MPFHASFSLARGSALAIGLSLLASAIPMAVSAAPVPPVHAGAVLSSPVAISPGKETTVLTKSVTTAEETNIRVTGWVSVTNPGRKATDVIFRYAMEENGIVETVGSDVVVTVPPKSSVAVPAGFQCDAEPAGTFGISVDVIASAPVTIESAAETILALPTASAGYLPSADVNGDGKVALGATATTLLETTLTVGDGSAVNALAEGWIDVRGGPKKDTLVTLEYSMDGNVMGTVTSIIGPDRSLSIPVGVQCDGVPTGQHVFKVTARAATAGPVFQSGFLSVVGLPTDGSIPNTHVNGDGKAVSLGPKATQLLSAPLTTEVQSDVWMGGWVTLDNPSSKPVTVSVQAAMGGSAEGPGVLATIPARGSLSVPFGLLCDGEAAGTGTLDVLAAGPGGGAGWDGDGIVMGWAIGAP